MLFTRLIFEVLSHHGSLLYWVLLDHSQIITLPPTPVKGAKYCDEHICVCVSVRLPVRPQGFFYNVMYTGMNFAKEDLFHLNVLIYRKVW